MQLLFAIIQDEDADALLKRLIALGLQATRLHSIGGFLNVANATILLAVDDQEVEQALAVIRATCRTRRTMVNPLPWAVEPGQGSLAAPVTPLEAEIGGATVFCLPVVDWLRVAAAPASSRPPATSEMEKGISPMHLILAIVPNEDTSAVSQALLAANHRLTRINTAGGFLRRGNATLLIGVEPDKTEEVLAIIRSNCHKQAHEGTTYGATAFVLEAARFVQI